MKSIKVIIVRTILFFYLISSYWSITHIHEYGVTQQNDCKICLVIKNIHGGETPDTLLNNFSFYYSYQPILFKYYNLTSALVKGFDANAPPYFL